MIYFWKWSMFWWKKRHFSWHSSNNLKVWGGWSHWFCLICQKCKSKRGKNGKRKRCRHAHLCRKKKTGTSLPVSFFFLFFYCILLILTVGPLTLRHAYFISCRWYLLCIYVFLFENSSFSTRPTSCQGWGIWKWHCGAVRITMLFFDMKWLFFLDA